jgi:hypothetical protein
MSNRDHYQTDLFLAFLFRAVFAVGLLGFIALQVAGCSADKDRSRAIDLGVKGSYTPGEAAGTRNQIPQGGIDEKSGNTPTKPAD